MPAFVFLSLFFSLIFPVLSTDNNPTQQPGADLLVRNLAFGSCNRQDLPNVMWDEILTAQPDLWLWTGDIVYADTENMVYLRQLYTDLMNQKGYRRVIESIPVVGVWDDHEYGANNAGKEYPMRAQSQQLLLDFLGEPKVSKRRSQEGIYTAYVLGPPGQEVHLILLDTRYHREEPGEDGDILGAEQWRWLEQRLAQIKSEVTIIVSSIQVIPKDHEYEKWHNFPRARQRLFHLLDRYAVPGVIFISGDRHLGEISISNEAPLPYPIHEITASGLTHAWTDHPGEPNRYRYGRVVSQLNFGMISLDWEADPVSLRMQIRGVGHKVLAEKKVALTTLR